MASLLETGGAWRAQIRRKGHKSMSDTFPTKAQAVAWARKIEAEIGATHIPSAKTHVRTQAAQISAKSEKRAWRPTA